MKNLDEKTVKDEIESFLKIAERECVIDGDISKELNDFLEWYLLQYR